MGRPKRSLLTLLIAAAACTGPAPIDPRAPRPAPKVEHAGALSELFDARAAPWTIALRPLLAKPHLDALGPRADMTGELVVWDGTAFTSRVANGRVVVATERDASVPLLVWSRVTKWREVAVPDDAWEPGATPVQALGFHATDAKGVWTHYDRNIYVHLRTLFGSILGHVDDFTLAPGAIIRIAAR